MRLIAPLILALLGALIGFGINKVIGHEKLMPHFSAIAGCAGAFIGLIVKDVLDLVISNDSLVDALIAAIVGAIVLSVVANLAAQLGTTQK